MLSAHEPEATHGDQETPRRADPAVDTHGTAAAQTSPEATPAATPAGPTGNGYRPRPGRSRTLAERTRRPTGRPSNPVICLSGGDQTGKTTQAVLLTASERVGPSWMVQLGEVDGDPYGAMAVAGRPVRYQLVEHDGTWPDIFEAVRQVRDEARAMVESGLLGGLPPVFIFDSMSKEWGMLSTWAENRARKAKANIKATAEDPNAAITVDRMYWNDANARNDQLMTLLLTFPGIVILTARGKWVSKTDPRTGNPTREREYTIEAQKALGHQVGCWVRLDKEEPPTIVNARFPRGPQGVQIVPGIDRPVVVDGRRDPRFKGVDFNLEWLIFDYMGYDPGTAEVRRLNTPVPGDEPDDRTLAEAAGVSLLAWGYAKKLAAARTVDEVREIGDEIAGAKGRREISDRDAEYLGGRYKARGGELAARQPAEAVA
jgi:hypothetical protein